MKNTWIIVANQADARLFQFKKPKGILSLVKKFENPEGRLKDGEIDADRSGRSFSSAGGRPHAYSEHTSSHEVVAVAFARELTQFIENARVHQEFDSLILITAPKFLGHLRKNLSPSACALIEQSIDLNFGSFTDEQITTHVESILKENFSGSITRDHTREVESDLEDAANLEAIDSDGHTLKILVNTDRNLQGAEDIQEKIKSVLEVKIKNFARRLTRVEVYLKDNDGPKQGLESIRCVLEARPRSMEPVSVSHQGANVMEAGEEASEKLGRLLKSTFEKVDRR